MKIPMPKGDHGKFYDRTAHRTAFLVFLDFLHANLNGQTALRVDSSCCSQVAALNGFGDVLLPDHVFREETLDRDLPRLASDSGHMGPPVPSGSVSHDGSLYRASGAGVDLVGSVLRPTYQRADELFRGSGQAMSETEIAVLRNHVVASALGRANRMNYAHAIVGGTRLVIDRFGADRIQGFIDELVEWIEG